MIPERPACRFIGVRNPFGDDLVLSATKVSARRE